VHRSKRGHSCPSRGHDELAPDRIACGEPARGIRDSNALAGIVRGSPQCWISIQPVSASVRFAHPARSAQCPVCTGKIRTPATPAVHIPLRPHPHAAHLQMKGNQHGGYEVDEARSLCRSLRAHRGRTEGGRGAMDQALVCNRRHEHAVQRRDQSPLLRLQRSPVVDGARQAIARRVF
jgi:hypothetical protein